MSSLEHVRDSGLITANPQMTSSTDESEIWEKSSEKSPKTQTSRGKVIESRTLEKYDSNSQQISDDGGLPTSMETYSLLPVQQSDTEGIGNADEYDENSTNPNNFIKRVSVESKTFVAEPDQGDSTADEEDALEQNPNSTSVSGRENSGSRRRASSSRHRWTLQRLQADDKTPRITKHHREGSASLTHWYKVNAERIASLPEDETMDNPEAELQNADSSEDESEYYTDNLAEIKSIGTARHRSQSSMDSELGQFSFSLTQEDEYGNVNGRASRGHKRVPTKLKSGVAVGSIASTQKRLRKEQLSLLREEKEYQQYLDLAKRHIADVLMKHLHEFEPFHAETYSIQQLSALIDGMVETSLSFYNELKLRLDGHENQMCSVGDLLLRHGPLLQLYREFAQCFEDVCLMLWYPAMYLAKYQTASGHQDVSNTLALSMPGTFQLDTGHKTNESIDFTDANLNKLSSLEEVPVYKLRHLLLESVPELDDNWIRLLLRRPLEQVVVYAEMYESLQELAPIQSEERGLLRAALATALEVQHEVQASLFKEFNRCKIKELEERIEPKMTIQELNRTLIRKGTLQIVDWNGTQSCMVCLFTDFLLCAIEANLMNQRRLEVRQWIPLANLKLTDMNDAESRIEDDVWFRLYSETLSLAIKAESREMKLCWVHNLREAISRNRPDRFHARRSHTMPTLGRPEPQSTRVTEVPTSLTVESADEYIRRMTMNDINDGNSEEEN